MKIGETEIIGTGKLPSRYPFKSRSNDEGVSDHYRGKITSFYEPDAYGTFLDSNPKLQGNFISEWPGANGELIGGFTYAFDEFPAVIKCTVQGLDIGQVSIQLLGDQSTRNTLLNILAQEEAKLKQ